MIGDDQGNLLIVVGLAAQLTDGGGDLQQALGGKASQGDNNTGLE